MRILLVVALMLFAVQALAQGRANENREQDPFVTGQRLLFDCISAPSAACTSLMGFYAGQRIEDPFIRASTLSEPGDGTWVKPWFA